MGRACVPNIIKIIKQIKKAAMEMGRACVLNVPWCTAKDSPTLDSSQQVVEGDWVALRKYKGLQKGIEGM